MLILTDEFKTRFMNEGYGGIASFCCIDGVHWQTHLFAYLPDILYDFSQKQLEIDLKLTIESKENSYPFICLRAILMNNSIEILCVEFNLDPINDNDRMAIEGLTVQTLIDLHLFKEDFSYHSTIEVPWYNQVDSWETYLLVLNLLNEK